AADRACQQYHVSDIDPFAYTHIHFAFGVLDENLLLALPESKMEEQLGEVGKLRE
ncbi:hypothetical protein HK102_011161, partial [Quaeritorhiza haematococci]